MKKPFTLSIPQPCGEKFGQFQKTDTGGFCQSCQKEVIDFTQMSEKEIVAYFKEASGSTCGRFRENQLKAYPAYLSKAQKPRYTFLGAGLLGLSLISLFFPPKVLSQDKKASVEIPASYPKKPSESLFPAIERELTVQGTVIDRSYGKPEPLPGVTVLIKGTDTGTVTGIDGRFSLSGLKVGDELLFMTIGYEIKTYKVPKDAPEQINMVMEYKKCDIQWMGEVAVDEVYTSRLTLWQKFKNLFR